MRKLLLALFAICLAGSGVAAAQSSSTAKKARPPSEHAQQGNFQDQRGTEQAPLAVKIVPTPKSDSEAAQDVQDRRERAEAERAKNELDRKLVAFNGDLAYYTELLVVFAGLQFCALVGQIVFLWFALRESRRAGDIARDAMIASNRAFVHHNGCRWLSHRHVTDGHIFWRIRPQWTNSGNTPTRQLTVHIRYQLSDVPLPDDFDFTIDEGPNTLPAAIGPKGTIESSPFDIDGSDLVSVGQGRKHLYMWGIARYRDVFVDTEWHITKFCVKASNITGDPEKYWDDHDNPVGIMFQNYGAYNCADDECSR